MILRLPQTGLALYFALAALNCLATESDHFIHFVDEGELPRDALEAFLNKRPVGKYRVVRIDTDALRQMLRDVFPPESDAETPSISLSLVDGAVVEVLLTAGGESHSGWKSGFASFRGAVAGDQLSTVQCLISPDGAVNLVIRTAGRRYKLEQTSILPYHVYWSLDPEFSRKID